jgi:hypothetical protein
MSGALTGPLLAAAGVLLVSGAAKLRAPGPTTAALATAGLPARSWLVRLLAVGETVAGAAALLAPGRASAALLALAYTGLAGAALVLARRRAACGCFGESDTPASGAQAAMSAALAVLAALAIGWPAHGLAWVLARPPATAAVLVAGLLAAVYGAVTTYTRLPAAWNAWSGR